MGRPHSRRNGRDELLNGFHEYARALIEEHSSDERIYSGVNRLYTQFCESKYNYWRSSLAKSATSKGDICERIKRVEGVLGSALLVKMSNASVQVTGIICCLMD